MSTHQPFCSVGFVLALLIAPACWAQTDAAPELPNWQSTPSTKPTVPLPEFVPPAAAPVPGIALPQPKPMVPRQRLSAEATANLPKQVQNVIDFYGGATSARALAQLPQRPSTGTVAGTPSPPPVRQQIKPFEGTVAGAPTLSPYLNLFIEDDNNPLPNYHTYVRPAFQQQSLNRSAERQLHTLESQVRTASYGQSVAPPAGVPGTGHGTRYFNTSRYYQPVRRLR